MTLTAKVFQNGRSQAIRIPKEFRVDDSEVYIEKIGDTLIIKPTKTDKWDSFFHSLDNVDTTGFLDTRIDLPLQKRELF
ncbi:MAG: antitoxin [Sulfurospirillum sp.]|jgi:antitoxin VapB